VLNSMPSCRGTTTPERPRLPAYCRSAIPNDTFMVRHSWISASLNVRDLLLLPEGLAVQFMVL
jgi:hypothetical protein